MTGALACFCPRWTINAKGESPYLHEFVDPSDASKSAPICKEWAVDYVTAPLFARGVSMTIVAVNFVLRLLIIILIRKVGFETHSEQTKYIKNSVFTVQFVNTALILLLSNADLTGWGFGMFDGRYNDFSPGWYSDIGNSITGAMIFNIIFPIIEFFGFYAMRLGFRILDQKYLCCKR